MREAVEEEAWVKAVEEVGAAMVSEAVVGRGAAAAVVVVPGVARVAKARAMAAVAEAWEPQGEAKDSVDAAAARLARAARAAADAGAGRRAILDEEAEPAPCSEAAAPWWWAC